MADTSGTDDSTRKQRLATAIQQEVVAGGRVETQGDYNAVLRFGATRGVNHVLHIVLSVLTAGLCLVVHVPLWLVNRHGRRTVTLNVDAYGNVLRQDV